VGIGAWAGLYGKLTVAETASASVSEYGVYAAIKGDADDSYGIYADASPTSGVTSRRLRGVSGVARNGSGNGVNGDFGTIGVEALAESNLQTTSSIVGMNGSARLTSSGAAYEVLGVRGYATAPASSTVTAVYGLNGHADNGCTGASDLYGAIGRATGPGLRGYGLKGEVRMSGAEAVQRFGVHGSIPGNGGAAAFRCGVYGESPVVAADSALPANQGSWAGYFNGQVRITNNGYVNGNVLITSDASLKTDVEDISEPLDLIALLRPKTYTFLPQTHPHMQLPEGRQWGLLAQEVMEVLPDLVEQVPVPAVYDSIGTEIFPPTSHLSLNYNGFIPLLIGAVQQQQSSIGAGQVSVAELRDELEELRALVAEQRVRMDHLEQALAACCANPAAGRSVQEAGAGALGASNELTGSAKLHIQPNPFNESTTVFYTLDRSGRTQLLANSSDGRDLRVLHEADLEAGEYQFHWNTAALAPGMYYITLLVDGQPVVKKAVKVDR